MGSKPQEEVIPDEDGHDAAGHSDEKELSVELNGFTVDHEGDEPHLAASPVEDDDEEQRNLQGLTHQLNEPGSDTI